MWTNRIKLEMIKHDDARIAVANKLKELKQTEECITNLNISADGGYMFYEICLSDKTKFTITDDGKEIR